MKKVGSLAQLVEQRPEEPCVPSSSLGGATTPRIDRVLLVKTLAFRTKLRYNNRRYAGLAQLLERFLAMEEARS